MQTITTKYHGYTNTKGSRISATSASGQRVVISTGSLPEELDTKMTYSEECHKWVALQLCKKLGWTGRIVGGETKGGYIFVFDPDGERIMKESLQALVTCHKLAHRFCDLGCPGVGQTTRDLAAFLNTSMSHYLPKDVQIDMHRYHDATEGN